MATIFKRPTSRFWNACYRDRNGLQKRPSTKLTDKAAALRMALEWERVERMAKEGTAGASQFQAVVNEVAKEVHGEGLPSPSIQAYLHEFLDRARRNVTASTLERYQKPVKLFIEYLGKAASQPIRTITPVMIDRFLHQRLEAGSAPGTAIVDIKILSVALKRAERLNYIDRNPVPLVTLPKAMSSEREIFTADEVEQLVAAAPNVDWQTMILLGAYAGVRLSDCLGMTWDNVNVNPDGSGSLVFQQKKTQGRVEVAIHPRLRRHLHHVSASHADGPLCPTLQAKTPGGKHGLSEGFKRIVKRAGLDLMVVEGKGTQKFTRRTFHSLRHTFVSFLANAGASERVSMALAGHQSSEIHRKYAHLGKAEKKAAIDLIPDPAAPVGASPQS